MKYLVFAFAILLTACATTTKKLSTISLGMSKEAVIKAMGSPAAVRGSMMNKYNQTIEVWEYRLKKPPTVISTTGKVAFALATFGMSLVIVGDDRANYWLFFSDGKLSRWGQAGDWAKESDKIYEMRFNSGNKL